MYDIAYSCYISKLISLIISFNNPYFLATPMCYIPFERGFDVD